VGGGTSRSSVSKPSQFKKKKNVSAPSLLVVGVWFVWVVVLYFCLGLFVMNCGGGVWWVEVFSCVDLFLF